MAVSRRRRLAYPTTAMKDTAELRAVTPRLREGDLAVSDSLCAQGRVRAHWQRVRWLLIHFPLTVFF